MSDRILFTEVQIQERVKALAQEISNDFRGKHIVLVGLFRGCFLLFADLSREIERIRTQGTGVASCCVDLLVVSSYDAARESRGRVQIKMDLQDDPKDKDVIIVDEVAETLYTIRSVVQHLRAKDPASLQVCVLVAKPDQFRCHEVPLRYVGFSQRGLPFLKGYGMDDDGKERGLPYVAACE